MDIQHQQTADNIATYIIGSSGNDVYQAFKVHPHLTAPQESGICGNRCIGRRKHGPGIQAQEKMDHGGITGNDHNGTFGRINPCTVGQLFQQPSKGFRSSFLQIRHMTFFLQSIGNPGQNIRSISRLPGDGGFFSDEGSGVQVHQLHHNGGGTIIHRKSIVIGSGVTGFHICNDPVKFPMYQSNRNIKSRMPAQGIQFPQHLQREGHRLIAQGIQGQFHPSVVTDRQLLRWHF